jgi:hypothetical protein
MGVMEQVFKSRIKRPVWIVMIPLIACGMMLLRAGFESTTIADRLLAIVLGLFCTIFPILGLVLD